jgi:hypothetical protein
MALMEYLSASLTFGHFTIFGAAVFELAALFMRRAVATVLNFKWGKSLSRVIGS